MRPFGGRSALELPDAVKVLDAYERGDGFKQVTYAWTDGDAVKVTTICTSPPGYPGWMCAGEFWVKRPSIDAIDAIARAAAR